MKRWSFWVFAPILLGAAGFFASAPRRNTAAAGALQFLLVVVPLLATVGLANPTRFRWAFRLVAVILLAAALASFRVFSAGDAALIVLLVGIPALQYLISGRSDTVFDAIAAPKKSRDSDASLGAS